MQIYLDHGATTPPRSEVISTIAKIMQSEWGNPSSLHAWGERSAMVIERSRIQVAQLLNCDPEEIIFTSGGTEANNLAILGTAWRYSTPQHMIISAVEHSAIAQPVEFLRSQGWQITSLKVDRLGRVNPQDLIDSIRSNTVLVSIIYGQNEVGTLQPIAKLSQICVAAQIPFHSDAVQVVGKLPIDLQSLPVDFLSLSSHKFYGIQGVGALFCRKGNDLVPLLRGGGQEAGMRSGTQPVAAIAGLGISAQLAQQELGQTSIRLSSLRDRLFAQLANLTDLIPTGSMTSDRLPHHLSFCQSQLDGREVVRRMNSLGIAISSGSACSSGKISPSPILLNMGFSDREATGGMRITLGRETSAADIDCTVAAINQVFAVKN
jgi:cysteine desulfurase